MLARDERFQHWLGRDFFPALRPYLRWTRLPVTWLGLAALATFLFGLVMQPMGLWLSAGIACVILLGLIWPWLALRGVACRLSFSESRTTEGEPVTVTMTLVNRWPWPLWGLAIVGGFHRSALDKACRDQPPIETALAMLSAWSESVFTWEFVPPCRGRYPTGDAFLVTGFPFGLWQSRRVVMVEDQLVAWPHRYAISSIVPDAGFDQTGLELADCRSGDAGDCLGVRPYRRGDTLRRIHWPQTARHNRLIVCERQASTRPAVRIVADLRGGFTEDSFHDNILEHTIRAAASICETLHRQHARLEYCDDEAVLCVSPDNRGLEQVLDRLAMIPENGLPCRTVSTQVGKRRFDRLHGMFEIVITADQHTARRRHGGWKTTLQRCILVGNDIESVRSQWEDVCRAT